MIYKRRTMPHELKALISLDKRLPNTHEKKHAVQKNLFNCQADYNGKLEFDEQINEFQPSYPHAILHDLNLQQDGLFFRIDSLLITPSLITVIEVKNFKDKTVIKANPTQFIRVFQNGDRKALSNPYIEVERKIQLLHNWLNKRGIQIPIDGLLVFSHTNELVIEHPSPDMKTLLTYEAPAHFRSLSVHEQILDAHAIHNLANNMISNHEDDNSIPTCRPLRHQPRRHHTRRHLSELRSAWHAMGKGKVELPIMRPHRKNRTSPNDRRLVHARPIKNDEP